MLDKYRSKRDFTGTREPKPSTKPGMGGLRFVVQKHAARRLHYDVRLELDGVLKSWAVPKGPSLNPHDKRLAVMVEDHPLDYGEFEGVIADGNYGAGQVIVWDAGVYSPDEDGSLAFDYRESAQERVRKGLESGKLSMSFRGRKLRGSWTLVKSRRGPNEWLLIKHKDDYADPSTDVLADEHSILSGLTVEDLQSGRLPNSLRTVAQAAPKGKKAPFPSRLRPMLAQPIDKPFSDPDWLFEPKLDGYRVLAFIREGQVSLKSRNDNEYSAYFPEVVKELKALPEQELVLDGEVVALNREGTPDFQLLQNCVGLERVAPSKQRGSATIVYYPFDLLYINGTSLTALPLLERKELLKRLLVPGEHVKPVEYVRGDGEAFFEAAIGMGLEGMVAKHSHSLYETGARNRRWLKVKGILEQDFVIGGYTSGSGARSDTFGALLLGYYEGRRLKFAGRVGSGFDQNTLKDLSRTLHDLEVKRIPFSQEVEESGEELHWTKPELVAKVKFAQWTEDGRLRAPVFLGLRADADPKATTRELVALSRPVTAREPRPDEVLLNSARSVLHQLDDAREKYTIEVGGHRISLTNLNKELWPAAASRPAITKRDMVRYYAKVAPALLPHLRDRPLTLTRYPNGIGQKSFYQKHWDYEYPPFVEKVRVFSSHNDGDAEYILVNNLQTLIWLAQLANIELHPWLSRTNPEPDAASLPTVFDASESNIKQSVLNYPDFIVFDLDPYIYSGSEKLGAEPELNRAAFQKVVEVALDVKQVLDQLSLSSFPKTSGKTGLHIYVPVVRQFDFSLTRKASEQIGRFLMQQRPKDITMEWSVDKRPGKVFLDHNQNVRSKNMASIYSLRPLSGAPASTPVRWDELDRIFPPTSISILFQNGWRRLAICGQTYCRPSTTSAASLTRSD